MILSPRVSRQHKFLPCSSPTARRAGQFGIFTRRMVAVLLVALAPAGAALAQAVDEARWHSHVDTFLVGTDYHSNFNTTEAGMGVAGGMSVDWRLPHVSPGGEVRGTYTSYSYMSQRSISVGPRIAADLGSFHPYADFLYGYGTAKFKQMAGTYNSNDSTVYTYGGGLDYGLTRFVAVRLDYQRQLWDFDSPKSPFHPDSYSVGVRYTMHMKGRRGPG